MIHANNSTKAPSRSWGRDLFGAEMSIALTIFGVLICVLDLLGNIVVIHIVRTRLHMRSTTNLLIANLAAADLLMVVVVAYLTKHFYVGFYWFEGVLGHVTCKLVRSIQPLSVLASVLTLCAITFDRFFAIMFPMSLRSMTFTRAKCVMALIWILSIAFSVPVTIVSMSSPFGDGNICFENWKAYGLTSRPYVIAFVAIGYFVPLVVIATLYSIMGVKLWKGSAPGYQTAEAMQRIKHGRRKATKMLITVVVVFTLCWFPLQLAEILKLFAPQIYRSMPFKLNWLFPYFGIANSVANPLIYVIFCEKFRSEFARILCPTRLVTPSDNVTLSSRSNPTATRFQSIRSMGAAARRSLTTHL